MAGIGGAPKLSVVQQDAALGDLLPALLSCERLVGQCDAADKDDAIVAGLVAQLDRCMKDIQVLMLEVEQGHSRQSQLNTEDIEWMIAFLVREVKDLGAKLRAAVALGRGKGR